MKDKLKEIKEIFRKKGFIYKDKLGAGGFADVYIAENNKRDYAIKIQLASDKKKFEKIKNECVLCKLLNGRNIIKTHAIYQDKLSSKETLFSIVMDKTLYMDMKFFFQYLLERNLIRVYMNNKNFPWLYIMNKNILIFFINQIVEGLKILYEHNYVHRDIKAENLLTAQSFIVKLCDFGIVVKGKPNFKLGSSTWCYEGPEYYGNKIIEKYEDCFKIDYYSIGLIIYYVIFRKNLVNRKFKNIIDLNLLCKCLDKADKNIRLHEFDEEETKDMGDNNGNNNIEVKKFDRNKKVKEIKSDSDSENEEKKIGIQFIDKGIGKLTRKLISKNISDRPNIFEILENESLNKNKQRINKIYSINQFLEIKLFIEFQKPLIYRKKRKKYKFIS